MRQLNLRVIPIFIFSVATFCIGCGSEFQGTMRSTAPADGAAVANLPTSEPFRMEAYDYVRENEFIEAAQEPLSTFSIDVDTASYSNVRRILNEGRLPPAGAVRLEELVNYFSYNYPEPSDEHPFAVNTELAACPWQPEHQLLRISLQGKSMSRKERPECNLVFLLDVSGSMMSADKLPLVRSAMKLLITKLKRNDRIAIVVYAGSSGVALPSTPAKKSAEIEDAIDRLQAGGGTNGAAGIHLAYQIAKQNFIPEGVNRVILCTDGDFNVGTTSQSELVDLVVAQAQSNVFLTVLGFGTGNLKDSMMEQLADKGNGNYAYIDSLLEARKVLVEQIGGTLVTIAKDVKIQVDFNPQFVQAYRLLGYENRLLDHQDFRDDTKDAGEIGAGHSVTAFYELTRAGSPSNIPSRRSSEFVTTTFGPSQDSQTMLTVNLTYKQPAASNSSEFQVRLNDSKNREPTGDFQFASAVLGYGMLLRNSAFKGNASWGWVVRTAKQNLGADSQGTRQEFIQLAEAATRLSLAQEE